MNDEFERKVFSVEVDYLPETELVIAERWRNQDGVFDRLADQPAVITYCPDTQAVNQLRWHQGKYPKGPHRDGDKPARIVWHEDGSEEHIYCKFGKLHRAPQQGPAVIHFDKNGRVEKAEYWFDNKQINPPNPTSKMDI